MSNGGRNILLGLGCIALAPVAVVGVAYGAAVAGTIAVAAGAAKATAVGAGVIAAKTAGISSVSLGTGLAAKGVGECLRD